MRNITDEEFDYLCAEQVHERDLRLRIWHASEYELLETLGQKT